MEATLEQERKGHCPHQRALRDRLETKDYQSEQFIEWFFQEQVEEESTTQDLLQVADAFLRS